MPITPVNFERKYLRLAVILGMLATLVVVGVYAYLGTFSRYFADDYCEADRANRASPLAAVLERYLAGSTRASNRYSNLFFAGLSESLGGSHSIPITATTMMLAWCAGLSWSVNGIRRYLWLDWPIIFDIYWGITLGFFSFLEAPNFFQSVMWRSSMMTHFAPLVFGSFLLAYVIRQLRALQTQPPARVAYLIVFVLGFVTAGFSEPPLTTMLTVLSISLGAVWFWGKAPVKQKHLTLLAWTFAGAFLGFLALVFSPASLNIAESRRMDVWVLIGNSFYYSYLFMVDSLKVIPLPLALNFFLPASFMWLYKQSDEVPLARNQIQTRLMAIVAIPIFVWLLIAAGFAPSVYGQNFPVERMRFLARTLMIVALMAEGMLFGYLLKGLRFPYSPAVRRWLVLGAFGVVAVVYPLRSALNVYQRTVPEYRNYAEQWDARDAYIRAEIAKGATDLVVVQYDSVNGIGEYKGNPNHWINQCAARYYGVNSIIAP